jgi:hypothetical protein
MGVVGGGDGGVRQPAVPPAADTPNSPCATQGCSGALARHAAGASRCEAFSPGNPGP